ncbi:unnamed protein product, partial [Rotaria sp. Silwood1]
GEIDNNEDDDSVGFDDEDDDNDDKQFIGFEEEKDDDDVSSVDMESHDSIEK